MPTASRMNETFAYKSLRIFEKVNFKLVVLNKQETYFLNNFEGTYNMDNLRWGQISKAAKDLIEKLIKVNESERISLDELKEHPWMSQCSEKSPLRCRAESEETLIHDVDEELDDDFKDDAIVINDEEFKNENRDETRSMDDSSSGIVLSDRNEGSSVSHEEIEPGHMLYDNQEDELITSTNDPMMSEAVVMVEEQMEPEDLSLKDELFKEDQVDEEEKVIEDESVSVTADEVQTIETPVIDYLNSRNRKGRSRRVTSKPAINNHRNSITKVRKHSQLPSNLPLDIVSPVTITEYEEEFCGFEIYDLSDDNFPCFGFDVSNRTDERERKTLILYAPLFSCIGAVKCDKKNDQVLVEVKAKRGRKRKAVSSHVVTEMKRPNTRNFAKNAIKELHDEKVVTKEPEEDVAPKRPRRGQQAAAAAATQKFFPSLEKLDPPVTKLRGTRRRVQQPMEVRIQINVNETSTKLEPVQIPRRGRPPKKIEVIPEQADDPPARRTRRTPKVEPVECLTVIKGKKTSIKREKEIPKAPAAKRGRKRKVNEEPECPKVEKKTRLTTVSEKSTKIPPKPRIKRARREEVEALQSIPMMKIKAETNKPSVIITYQQPQQLIVPPLSMQFRRTINNLQRNYVDNKEQPSFIPSRFVKPEPAEQSAITMYEDASSSSSFYLKNYYR